MKTNHLPGLSDLKDLGLKVKVIHYRFRKDNVIGVPVYFGNKPVKRLMSVSQIRQSDKNLTQVDPNGGIIEVTLINEAKGSTAVGRSYCSVKDNFNKRKGLQIALAKALGGAIDEAPRTYKNWQNYLPQA